MSRLSWNASYQLSESEFDGGDRSDTEIARGIVSFRFLRRLSFDVNGTYENNDFVGDRGDFTPDDSTYGAGFTWAPSRNFSLSAAYNERSDPRPDEDESFGSGNFSWSPTVRTQISGSYGNRFFGETYDFSFNHRSRRTSTVIAYNEGVSDFRQQFLQGQQVGSIICPIGVTTFTDCRNFDQSNPPQPGEQVVGIIGLVPSISNNTFILKSLNTGFTVRGGKNVVSLGVNSQRREFVADDDNEREIAVTLSWQYQFGPRSTSSLSFRGSERSFDDNSEDNLLSVNWLLSRRLTPRTSISLEFYFDDRDSEGGGQGRTYEENRVTFGLTSRF